MSTKSNIVWVINMLLNLYEVIYIACIDVFYSQFFVVRFQHVVHKILQVAP